MAVYLATNGVDSGDGNAGAPYATIEHAVQNLDGERKIIVLDGVYNRTEIDIINVVSDAVTPLIVEPAPGASPVFNLSKSSGIALNVQGSPYVYWYVDVDGMGQGASSSMVRWHTSPNGKLEGCTITNTQGHVLYITGSPDMQVRNADLSMMSNPGTSRDIVRFTGGSDRGIVDGCHIHDGDHTGVQSDDSDVVVTNNVIELVDGHAIARCRGGYIVGNVVRGVYPGPTYLDDPAGVPNYGAKNGFYTDTGNNGQIIIAGNRFYGIGAAPVYVDNGDGTIYLLNNTMYNCARNPNYSSDARLLGYVRTKNGALLDIHQHNNVIHNTVASTLLLDELQAVGSRVSSHNVIYSDISATINYYGAVYNPYTVYSETGGMIGTDPALADPANGDLSLLPSSAAIAAGTITVNGNHISTYVPAWAGRTSINIGADVDTVAAPPPGPLYQAIRQIRLDYNQVGNYALSLDNLATTLSPFTQTVARSMLSYLQNQWAWEFDGGALSAQQWADLQAELATALTELE